ncbi:hypothetical protein EG327_007181 [Venturia inaequalis]|uniref:Uncharacterized protein n=1 Tax=Venturia inaequalis TaxID=5025 RepID=A0A8H3V087_VENIN|nr:hypothetical protein EG327_007181 [Venturia inaequalis]
MSLHPSHSLPALQARPVLPSYPLRLLSNLLVSLNFISTPSSWAHVTTENAPVVGLAIEQVQISHRIINGINSTPSGRIAPKLNSKSKPSENDKKPWLQRRSVSASLAEKPATK